jgi:hypothetical protein
MANRFLISTILDAPADRAFGKKIRPQAHWFDYL